MCRMAAMVSLNPLNTNALVGWLSDLALLRDQCDGWGITAYRKKNLVLYFREPTPIWERPSIHFPKANMTIVHVRKASEGSIKFLNSHPFVRIFEGKCWSFCHNGSVNKDLLQKDLDQAEPVGETDSEILFLYILDHLKGLEEPDEIFEGLSEATKALMERREELKMSAVNFLLTDGFALFAFRGARLKEHWFTLYVKDFKIQRRTDMLKYSIVSSEPLPQGSECWEALDNWTLLGRWFDGDELVRRKINLKDVEE